MNDKIIQLLKYSHTLKSSQIAKIAGCNVVVVNRLHRKLKAENERIFIKKQPGQQSA